MDLFLGFRYQALGIRSIWARGLAFVFICWALLVSARAAEEKQWELSGYRIKVHLAVDTSARPQTDLEEKIAQTLEQRIYATLYPLWSVEFSLATGPFHHALVHHMADLAQETEEESSSGFDKEMYLAVVATAEGTRLLCREVDRYTSTWGPVLRRDVRQEWMVAEQCFDLLQTTFAPLAKIRKVADEKNHVELHFKGSSLPRRSEKIEFTQPGIVYQPLKVRAGRRGTTRPDSIVHVPWTYLTLEEMQGDIGRCLVHAGIRQPFGVRRRGRVEHLAIALRQPPQNTRVRFYARHDETQPLIGYEVFQRDADDQPSRLLGLTDAQGSVNVLPGETSVTTLLLRSDGKLLAKLPIVPGVLTSVEVPIADDTARLKAQATLTSLREQLIDLVARRNILIARVRDRLENGKLDEARELISELDALPGRANFAQLLSAAERNGRNRSDEPRVQARIEEMFADTRKLLGKFLSTRQITDLQSELSAARSGDSS